MAFLLPLISFALVLALIPLARRGALALDFVDRPGGRKTHENPVPPIGGIVIFGVFLLCLPFSGLPWSYYAAYIAALLLVLITGVIDDYAHVTHWVKFVVHFTAAIVIVMGGGAQIQVLGDLFGFGVIDFGFFAPVFSVACVVYLINAVNMMDGLDGLAAGKSLVILLWLMAACALGGFWGPLEVLGILAAGLAGFLVYNMRHPFREKACVFLGDAGSMALGLTLSWFCISLANGPDPVVTPIAIAWIIALPIVDAFGLFLMRLTEGRHPFDPDRRHFHHHFIHAGIPVGRASVMILGWSALLGLIGYGGIHLGVPLWVLGYGWVALWVSHTLLVLRPGPFVRLLEALERCGGKGGGSGRGNQGRTPV